MTDRVLDRDLLDEAAARLLGPVRVDPAAVRMAADARARRLHRRLAAAAATTCLAATAAVLLVVSGAVPGVTLPDPLPATPPSGPGSLPETVRIPPPWTPSATDRPMSRVAYAVRDTQPFETAGESPGHAMWLVGADEGEYRYVPANDPQAVTVSPDGSRVAWVEPETPELFPVEPVADVLTVLDVREGAVRSLDLPGIAGRGFAVTGTAFSPDGGHLAVWGINRVNDGGIDTPHLLDIAVDAKGLGPARQVCECGSGVTGAGFAWTGDGRLVGEGLGGPTAGATVSESGVLTLGWVSQPLLVSVDGGTAWVIQREDLEAQRSRYRLIDSRGQNRGVRRHVDLGNGTAAAGLTATERGVVVSRWTDEEGAGLHGAGPNEVLLADPDGLRTLTRAVSPTARVVAVAAGVVDGGRLVPATPQQARGLDPLWYGWLGRRVGGWVAGLPLALLLVAGVALLLGFLWLGRARTPRVLELLRRVRVPLGALSAGAAVALLAGAALLGGGVLAENTAKDSPAFTALTNRVLPRAIVDQHVVPPRAFHEPERPGTRRISALLAATVAGRDGIYGLDAVTARLVRLDDLPGLGENAAMHSTMWGVSPNGRFLATPKGIVDLETARLRTPSVLSLGARMAPLDDGTLVVAADNGKGVWVHPHSGPSRRVAGTAGAMSAEAQQGSRVLLRFLGADRSLDRLAAVLDVRTDRLTPIVSGSGQTQPLAVTAGGELVTSQRLVHRPGADGAITVVIPGDLPTPRPAVARMAVQRDGTMVAVGAGTPAATALLTGQALSGKAGRGAWHQFVPLALPVADIQLAADAVAAVTIDAREPAWAVVAAPGWQQAARWLLAFGALLAGLRWVRSAGGHRTAAADPGR